jgi:hypothetical protein
MIKRCRYRYARASANGRKPLNKATSDRCYYYTSYNFTDSFLGLFTYGNLSSGISFIPRLPWVF